MTEYEIQWQTQEMRENGEWEAYHCETCNEALAVAWEMKDDADYVTVVLYIAHRLTIKDNNTEEDTPN